MSNFQIFLWALLLICFTSYVICGLLVISNYKSLIKTTVDDLSATALYNNRAFVKSILANSKDMLRLQGWILFWTTVILAIFDSQYYIVASMFTALFATAHFYFSSRIK